jgi:hypothetical protein
MKWLKALPAPLVVVMVGAGVLVALGMWDRSISERDRRLDAQTKAALEMSQSWSERYDRAVTKAAEDSATLARLAVERRLAQAEADSLSRELDALPEPALDDASGWRLRYQMRSREAIKLRSALTTAQGEIVTLRTAERRWRLLADSAYTVVIPGLEKALRDERDARQCRILGLIRCPSRTLAFVAGAAVATVVTVAVVK